MKTKGLEPIVAAVLLIVVAVIGAVLVYLWFAGYVTKTTSQAEQMAASEKLKIEAAMLDTTPQAILYIRNLGGDKVQLTTAYILRPGTLTPICISTTINPNTLEPNPANAQKVTISGFSDAATTCNIQSGYDYVVKIVTAKGTEFAVTVTAS